MIILGTTYSTALINMLHLRTPIGNLFIEMILFVWICSQILQMSIGRHACNKIVRHARTVIGGFSFRRDELLHGILTVLSSYRLFSLPRPPCK